MTGLATVHGLDDILGDQKFAGLAADEVFRKDLLKLALLKYCGLIALIDVHLQVSLALTIADAAYLLLASDFESLALQFNRFRRLVDVVRIVVSDITVGSCRLVSHLGELVLLLVRNGGVLVLVLQIVALLSVAHVCKRRHSG